ncbi:MAG: peptidylprolyl isomerase [Treponema sp.]|nr:peptidylprolyl isomerase [Treponema sp.]
MKRIAFLVLVSSCLVTAVFAQAGLQPAAVVNLIRSEPITVGQLRTEVERMERALGQPLNGQQRREVLDAMINERLVLQAAERDRMAISENELNQHINQLRAQMVPLLGRQPTDAEFATAVRNETGLELPAFREQTRRQLTQQNYLFTQKRALFEGVRPPADAEIVSMFELTRSQFVRPETVRVSMIQVPYGTDAASRTRARQQIDALAREIGNSAARFTEVITRSQAPNSNFQGGDFGFLPRNLEAVQRLGQTFVNTAFGLRPGEISRVIEGPPGSGYQILKVTESHVMRSLELDDQIQPGSPITVRTYIANVMMRDRQMTVFAQAANELHTELRAGGRTFQVFEANINW